MSQNLDMTDFICEWLGKNFDLPCSYTIDGKDVPDYMDEHCPDWCEQWCGVISAGECWRKYFTVLMEDKTYDARRTEKPGTSSGGSRLMEGE